MFSNISGPPLTDSAQNSFFWKTVTGQNESENSFCKSSIGWWDIAF